MLHVDIHVHVFKSHVDISYLGCRGQKNATMLSIKSSTALVSFLNDVCLSARWYVHGLFLNDIDIRYLHYARFWSIIKNVLTCIWKKVSIRHLFCNWKLLKNGWLHIFKRFLFRTVYHWNLVLFRVSIR